MGVTKLIDFQTLVLVFSRVAKLDVGIDYGFLTSYSLAKQVRMRTYN